MQGSNEYFDDSICIAVGYQPMKGLYGHSLDLSLLSFVYVHSVQLHFLLLLRRDNIYAFCLDKLSHPVLGHLGDIENKMQKWSRVQDQQIQCSNVSTYE